MKKIKFLSLALLATMYSLVMVSCDDDDATVDENDVPNGTEVINYSIQIIPTSLNGKVAGLADVKVTVNQNGTKQTKTTDASGIVAFDKFKEGYVSIYVQGPEGFISLNVTDELNCSNCVFGDNDSEQTEYDQNTITLPRLGATLRGKLFGDANFDNNAITETLPTAAVVVAKLPIEYEPNVYKLNVQSDGTFQFTNLPEGVPVTLSLDFKIQNTVVVAPAKPYESTFSLPGGIVGPHTLDINNPKSLGNIETTHN